VLKETVAAKKRNTDLAFLIGGNDANMDEETRAWYDPHRKTSSGHRRLRPPLRHLPRRFDNCRRRCFA
jgi:hypothetical protein